MRRPETAGELMQFLQVINWMRTSLPELAELEASCVRNWKCDAWCVFCLKLDR